MAEFSQTANERKTLTPAAWSDIQDRSALLTLAASTVVVTRLSELRLIDCLPAFTAIDDTERALSA